MAQASRANTYWEKRYASGGNSGAGSRGDVARWKADKLMDICRTFNVQSIIDLGVGDGYMLDALLSRNLTASYNGVDVSQTTVSRLKQKYNESTHNTQVNFHHYDGTTASLTALRLDAADVVFSLDVIYHLVDDHLYDEYMQCLWTTSQKLMVIFSSNYDGAAHVPPGHIRHRRWQSWLDQHYPTRYRFVEIIDAPLPRLSGCGWYVIEKLES